MSAKRSSNKPLHRKRVDLRRNRAPTVRKKDWTRLYTVGRADVLDDETPSQERLGKTAQTRKRTLIETTDGLPAPALEQDQKTGTVLVARGYFVEVDTGEGVRRCVIRGMLRKRLLEERSAVAVGDRVKFTPIRSEGPGEDKPEGVIEAVLPRRSILARQQDDRLHVIAANVDQSFIVSSVDMPPIRPHLIDRYIVAAEAGDITPIICVNKIDLEAASSAKQILQRYADLGYQTLATSVVTGEGIEQLRELLKDKSSVLVGQSGVGKSSLLNAVQPGLQLRVGQVNPSLKRGRHTTSTAQLLKLDFGGYVVDTPGIRQLQLPKIDPGDIEMYFVEFADLVRDCKFANCTHIHETGCAVRQAVEQGRIHPERYESYVRMIFGEWETSE